MEDRHVVVGVLRRGGGGGGGALEGDADKMLGVGRRRVGKGGGGGVGVEEYEVAAGRRLGVLLVVVGVANVSGIHENQRL